jgi:catechol 2,3-dioxygenase-like lactoylglutathione lyase family enzyme
MDKATQAATVLVNLDVPDLERAIAFYTAATDCRLERRLDAEIAELSYGAARLYLVEKGAGSVANAGTDQTRSYSRHWTPAHVDFVVADLDEAVAKAERAGAKRESSGETWRGATHVTFSDPFGHGFCLITFRAHTYE